MAILLDLNEGFVANAVKVKVTTPDAVGIENVNANKSAADNHFYNLQGQRLSKAQKGVNIVNGRKIVRK